MSDIVLIDPPVTPYSPRGEILAWARVCQEALIASPDSQAWKDALVDARRLLDEADLPGDPAGRDAGQLALAGSDAVSVLDNLKGGPVNTIKIPRWGTIGDFTEVAEHKALGMVGTIEAFAGFEKLEGKIKWSSLYADALKKTANPFQSVQLQVRGSVEVYSSQGRSEEKPVVALLTVIFKSLPGGNYKQHDNVEIESEFTATYMKLTVGGEDVTEIDVLANIYKAAGQDVLASYRANIGG